MDVLSPGRTIRLIQLPHRFDPRGRGWLLKANGQPPEKWSFRDFLGDPLPEFPLTYKIIDLVGFPMLAETDAHVMAAMTPLLKIYASSRLGNQLGGRLLTVAHEAMDKDPYVNAVWILKATPEELDRWAFGLASHGY